jgi:hypothetical protein
MTHSPVRTLTETVNSHWRAFAPAWIFPFVFLYGGVVAEKYGHPMAFFLLVAAPLFFWSFTRASAPWRKREAEYWPVAFWSMFVPFLLWVFAVFSRLALVG